MEEKYIRLAELANRVMPDGTVRPGIVPVAPPTIWRWAKSDRFPKPVRLCGSITAWKLSEVNAWLAAQNKDLPPKQPYQRQPGFMAGAGTGRRGRPRKVVPGTEAAGGV